RVAVVTLLLGALLIGALAGGAGAVLAPGRRPQCRDPYSARREPGNPLLLRAAPGSDPLNGANLFVNGPAHGAAAGAIARLLGIDTGTPVGSVLHSFSESESWARFSTF